MGCQDTGSWLLENPEYKEWRDGDGDARLCVSGPAGSGKTVLSAVILQDLHNRLSYDEGSPASEKTTTCVLYFYLDLRDAYKNSTAGFYDGLVRQLLHYNPLGYAEILELAKKNHRMHPDAEEYVRLVLVLIKEVLTSSNVFLVIDGCDRQECKDFEALLDMLALWGTSLFKVHDAGNTNTPGSDRKGHWKMLATSRSYSEIQHLYSTEVRLLEYPLAVTEDIQRYVEEQIQALSEAARHAMGEKLLKKNIKQSSSKVTDCELQPGFPCFPSLPQLR